ncbi:MAG: hypothetical protein LBC95_01670 [Candidatus Nomurabacteria bacterium]|jgi:hypothetical protein|nr:hypothetical protein [Candidatus Nomurabacteria bacterium]
MGLFIQNQGKRSDLQERVAAELREKLARDDAPAPPEAPDGVDDSNYVRDYEKSSPLPRGVIVGIVAGVIVAIAIVVISTTS